MKPHRIFAIFLRHIFNFRRSFDRLSDAFYWPTIDLIIWGLTSSYFVSLAPNTGKVMLAVIGGIIFWVIPWRAQYEITVNVLVELWDKNLTNIFVAPLKFSEWITSLILVGLAKALVSVAFAALVAYVLYKVNIFSYGFYLLPFLFLLLMFGWWVGFLVAAILMRYGSRVQTLAWTVTWAAAPFSAIYFPVSILPDWAQLIARALPSSYVFEGGRQVIFEHTLNWSYVWISLFLNILYLTISIVLFRNSFKKALERGLQGIN
ncbi:MAG: ABC transporter permease [Candidatus Levybacteria bacterium]|nr:ABC transporter permease [Candidatus Levybacteria bacterium]